MFASTLSIVLGSITLAFTFVVLAIMTVWRILKGMAQGVAHKVNRLLN